MLSLTIRYFSISSTLLLGLMAGFFATYSFNVNYATLALNGEMYAIVQSLFNTNVRHPGFFLCFFGAGAMSVITGLLGLVAKEKTAKIWIAIGITYVVGIIFFTRFVNLPLNFYTETWNPMDLPADWPEVRAKWNQANLFRTVISFGLFSTATFLLASPSQQSALPET
ncbi:anthrone oxygenase family protein [Nitrincola sp. MINF-07-Sa-05]|uniref:anthrone oxygenase family protein n=1 Tax=Nitrincola salilacus TaxID=3400273 RepID=UPI0039180E52